MDFMNVMADIGDMQSVSSDLSTFSGHLVVCREMLRHARVSAATPLVLLDEIGTGTDPAQGAALAQAVLEELLDAGSRVRWKEAEIYHSSLFPSNSTSFAYSVSF